MISRDFFKMAKSDLKFVYSEEATKFCEIFTLFLSTVHTGKSKVKMLQNFVDFLEYLYELYLPSSQNLNNLALNLTSNGMASLFF